MSPPSNTSNTLSNTSHVILGFLESRTEEYMVKVIASETGINRNTVGYVLFNLRKDGKVISRRAGRCSFFSATKNFSDELTRLYKQHSPTNEKVEIHGLTLKLKGKFTNTSTLGVGRDGIGLVSQSLSPYLERTISFQLSRETLMLYVDCSHAPLDYEEYLLFLSHVDGCLNTLKLPTLRGELGRWLVCQYGFNRDFMTFRNDSPTKAVTLKAFSHWLARCYEKEFPDGSVRLREEFHSLDEEVSLREHIEIVRGGMNVSQIANSTYLMARSIEGLKREEAETRRLMVAFLKRLDKIEERREKETG